MSTSTIQRLFLDNIINIDDRLCLSGDHYHYIKNVLRLKIDSKIKIFNKQYEFICVIELINKRDIVVYVKEFLRAAEDMHGELILALAILKPKKMTLAINYAVQLGVTRIIPVITQGVQFDNLNIQKILKVIIEATEQSNRITPPTLSDTIYLSDIYKFSHDIIFANENEKDITIQDIPLSKDLILLVGPEGGFAEQEKMHLLSSDKVYSVKLHEYILRSEVATVALLANVQLMKN